MRDGRKQIETIGANVIKSTDLSPPTTWRSPKVEVREGAVAGVGVFALEKIEAGEVVIVKAGHVVSSEEAARLDREIGDYSLQIAEDLFLCPKSQAEVPYTVAFLNHSCSPNVGLQGQIAFVAMRDIEPGEEVVYDYAMATTHKYELKCECGTEHCRGVITGDDWKRPELRERYKGFFAQFIENRIKEGRG